MTSNPGDGGPSASREAMTLGERFTLNAANSALRGEICVDAGCPCGGYELARDAALTIDALCAARVAEARFAAIEDCLDILREDQTLYESVVQIRALRALSARQPKEET